jgi:glycosyltransferase involved in cell wall biosynthesis
MAVHNILSVVRKDCILKELISNAPRMLIVWSWLPCNSTGAGILMRRLFADYPPDRLWALTSTQSTRNTAPFDPAPPAERQVPVPEIQIRRKWLDKLALLLNRLLLPWTVWHGVRLARKEKIEAILTVPWDHFTIAAYLIHKFTGLPLYMYVMDDPVGARKFGGLQPILYAMLMPRIARACKRVWGVSKGMCEYFERTYGVKCLPLLPLLDLKAFQRKIRKAHRTDNSFHIVFTGSIYSAQVDAVNRLVRVVDRQPTCNDGSQAGMQLTLYTSSPASALETMGLVGNNVHRDEVRQEDVACVMAEADVAFLPLSFEPKMRHVVETSLPSKIAEYLAAGLPILAHAPPSSTVARYCRKYECGLVVDAPDEGLLQGALLRLKSDAALRHELSAKALEAAKQNHDASRIAASFIEQLSNTGT